MSIPYTLKNMYSAIVWCVLYKCHSDEGGWKYSNILSLASFHPSFVITERDLWRSKKRSL